jgi:hypothetical protein
MSPKDYVAEALAEIIPLAGKAEEPPRPLMREMPAPDPFPTDALGPILANAAIGIQDRTQAPVAICGQSVLPQQRSLHRAMQT